MKKNLLKFISIVSLLVFYPFLTFAAGPCDALDGLKGFLCKIHELLSAVVPILIALGVVYFVWGVVQYVIADGEEAKKAGKDRMIYGIIGFAVIIGLWGLVYLITNTFGISSTAPTNSYIQDLLPKVPR